MAKPNESSVSPNATVPSIVTPESACRINAGGYQTAKVLFRLGVMSTSLSCTSIEIELCMAREFTQGELEAYLDESLDADRSREIEQAVREDPALLKRLAEINARRDSGVHSLGDIWRRHQLGVPSVETLGSFLLGILDEGQADYIRFRVEVLKCRFTIAKLRDLEEQAAEEPQSDRTTRKTRYINSTSHYFSDREE